MVLDASVNSQINALKENVYSANNSPQMKMRNSGRLSGTAALFRRRERLIGYWHDN
jgi:hypothetical protein